MIKMNWPKFIQEKKRSPDVSVSLYEPDQPISLEGKNFVAPNYYGVKSVSQPSEKKQDDEEKEKEYRKKLLLSDDAYAQGRTIWG